MPVERRDPAVCNDSDKKEGKGEMTKAPICLQDLRRSLYVKAKAEPTWRFWGLYVHVCKMETLHEAYQMARKNDGAPGIDGVTFDAIEEGGAKGFLQQIKDELVSNTYRPMRVRKKEIPKDGGKVRILSIPSIRDRVVQGALKLILEPIFEADFQSGSYGYRPKRTAQLLCNVYLHYAFDLWVQRWRKQRAMGEVIVVRYADDSVLGFQYRADAERFLREWRERLQKFGLELHPGKTCLIEFGRFAARDRKQRGEGKPETFNFLGFTHICGESWKNGKFFVLRKTIRERLLAKLKQVKAALRARILQPLAEVGKWLKSVVQGYFNYHAVPGNLASLRSFRFEIRKRWLHVIRRRSQRSRMTWELLEAFAIQWLPVPKILHPYPLVRFDARYLR